MNSLVPTNGAENSSVIIPARLPPQSVMSFVDLKVQEVGLVGCRGITLINPLPGPVLQDPGNKLTNRTIACQARSEVEGFAGGMWIERK